MSGTTLIQQVGIEGNDILTEMLAMNLTGTSDLIGDPDFENRITMKLFEGPVAGFEESAAIQLALGVGDLRADRVQPLVHPAIVLRHGSAGIERQHGFPPEPQSFGEVLRHTRRFSQLYKASGPAQALMTIHPAKTQLTHGMKQVLGVAQPGFLLALGSLQLDLRENRGQLLLGRLEVAGV